MQEDNQTNVLIARLRLLQMINPRRVQRMGNAT